MAASLVSAISNSSFRIGRWVWGHKILTINIVQMGLFARWAVKAYRTRPRDLPALPQDRPTVDEALAQLRQFNEWKERDWSGNFGDLTLFEGHLVPADESRGRKVIEFFTLGLYGHSRDAHMEVAAEVQTWLRTAIHVLQTSECSVNQYREIETEVGRFNAFLFGSHGVMGPGMRVVHWVRGTYNWQFGAPVAVVSGDHRQRLRTVMEATQAVARRVQGEGRPAAVPAMVVAYADAFTGAIADRQRAEEQAVGAADGIELTHRKWRLAKVKDLAFAHLGPVIDMWEAHDLALFDAATQIRLVEVRDRAAIRDYYELLRRHDHPATLRGQSYELSEQLNQRGQLAEILQAQHELCQGEWPQFYGIILQRVLPVIARIVEQHPEAGETEIAAVISFAVAQETATFFNDLLDRAAREIFPRPTEEQAVLIAYQRKLSLMRYMALQLKVFDTIAHWFQHLDGLSNQRHIRAFVAAFDRMAHAIGEEKKLNLAMARQPDWLEQDVGQAARTYAERLSECLLPRVEPTRARPSNAVMVVETRSGPLQVRRADSVWQRFRPQTWQDMAEHLRGLAPLFDLSPSSLGVKVTPSAATRRASERAASAFLVGYMRNYPRLVWKLPDFIEEYVPDDLLLEGGPAPLSLTQ